MLGAKLKLKPRARGIRRSAYSGTTERRVSADASRVQNYGHQVKPWSAKVERNGGRGETVAMVLSGGVALGAYQAGAYVALHEAGGPYPVWFAGSSTGAINTAIITGNPP